MAPHLKPALLVPVFAVALALIALASPSPCSGQTLPPAPVPDQTEPKPPQPTGSISGTVVDQTGAIVARAQVRLTRDGQAPTDQSPAGQAPLEQSAADQAIGQETQAGDDGQFTFSNVAPGPFRLTVTAAGFATRASSGILQPGQIYTAPPIAMVVATTVTDVEVALSAPEVAEAQVKDEEKQRVLRVIPNFYVTYDPHPVSLSPKQKFELAWKTTIDPFTFGVIGAIAGIQQAQNDFSGYGQGAEGYGKRYGASYANLVAGTFIGSAILPSLLKQDPRYFYKGTGTRKSRILYALANSLMCKGDNGRWQVNYSNILGNLAAGGISNLYYPADNRSGLGLTFENAFIGIGATGAANIFQEFFVKKFTPSVANHTTVQP